MNNPYKVGDTVRLVDTKENRDQFAKAIKESPTDAARRFEDTFTVKDISASLVKVGAHMWMLASRFTADRRHALGTHAAPAVLPSRQLAWDKYAEDRRRQGHIVLPGQPRELGFMAGYDQGYLRSVQDAKAIRISASEGDGLARKEDPATSKQAAAAVQAGKLTDLVLVTLRDKGPMTAHEVAEATGHALNAISPRFAQLKRKGLIHVSGGKKVGKAHRSVYTYGGEQWAGSMPDTRREVSEGYGLGVPA